MARGFSPAVVSCALAVLAVTGSGKGMGMGMGRAHTSQQAPAAPKALVIDVMDRFGSISGATLHAAVDLARAALEASGSMRRIYQCCAHACGTVVPYYM